MKMPAKRIVIGVAVFIVLIAGGFAGWYWYSSNQSDEQSAQSTTQLRSSFGGEVRNVTQSTIQVRNTRLEQTRTFTITGQTKVVDDEASEVVELSRIETGMNVNVRYDTRNDKAVSIWF